MRKKIILFLCIAIIATTLGVFVRKIGLTNSKPTAKMPDMVFSTLAGKEAKVSDWRGQVLVLNFWATWCPPCREEMPAFSAVNTKLSGKSVQFVGIGIDTPDNILLFQKTTPVSYPLFIAGYDTLKLTAELGNKSLSLPFTLILDREGKIVLTHQGKLDEPALQQHLAPLLADKK